MSEITEAEDVEVNAHTIMEHLTGGGEEVEKPAPLVQKHLDDLPPAITDKPKKERAQRATPIQKWLGTAETVRVHKRLQNGKRELIGNFRKEELEASSDMETFLVNYVMPTHGPGTYEPTYVDKAGKELRYPEITIAAPLVQGPASGAITQRDILDIQAKAKADALAEEERVAKKVAALGSGNDALIQLLARQQETQTQLLMRQIEEGGKPIPLPPPPPQQDVGALMTAMMAPVMTMMQAMMQQSQQQMQMQMQVLQSALAPKNDDEKWQRMIAEEKERAREERERERERRSEERERARDERERERAFYQMQMETVKAQSSTDPLEKAFAIFETADKLKERFGGESNSIADVLGSVAEKLPEILNAAAKHQPQPARQVAKLDATKQQKEPVEESEDEAAAAEEAPPVGPLEIPESAKLPMQRLKQVSSLPEEKQVEEQIRTSILLFQALYAAGGDWAAAVNQLLVAIQSNDDKTAKDWVQAILGKVVESGGLDAAVAKATYDSLAENWNAAVDMLRRAAAG